MINTMGKEQSEKIPINSRGELWGDFAKKSKIQKSNHVLQLQGQDNEKVKNSKI